MSGLQSTTHDIKPTHISVFPGSLGIAQCSRSQRGQQQDVSAQQQEDIAAVAPLIFRVAGGSSGAPHLAALSSHVSPHLLHVLASLQNNHVRDCQTVSHTAPDDCTISALPIQIRIDHAEFLCTMALHPSAI